MSIHRYLLFLSLPLSLFAQQNTIPIAFQDLASLLSEASPEQHMIQLRRTLLTTHQEEALQWSNPQLQYQHEFVENSGLDETEQQLYLSKTFSMPWNYWLQRQISQAHIEAAELQAQQESKNLLAMVRTAYVRLSLLQTLNDKQRQLRQHLQNIKQVVQAQNIEGAISATDAQLSKMILRGLQGDILNSENEKRLQEASLKQMLSYSDTQKTYLTTTVSYIKPPDDFISRFELNDELDILKSGIVRLQAFEKGITLEKAQIIDHFSLSGGWKKVEPGWEGYTIGISIPLPVLNLNGPQIEQQRIAREIQLTENNIKRQNIQNKTNTLVALIKGYQEVFDSDEDLYNINLIEQLSAAWREGTITLNEFLNAIQIYRLAARQNTDQLVAYYKAVFELQALYDIDLVTL